jgi:hypothetical protein
VPAPLAVASRGGRLAGCCSVLSLVHRLLPVTIRQDALDECIDELECAAAENRPLLRRTLSISFRAVPILAIASRVQARRPSDHV